MHLNCALCFVYMHLEAWILNFFLLMIKLFPQFMYMCLNTCFLYMHAMKLMGVMIAEKFITNLLVLVHLVDIPLSLDSVADAAKTGHVVSSDGKG